MLFAWVVLPACLWAGIIFGAKAVADEPVTNADAAPLVQRATFLKAVTGWRAARREVRALRRTLRHEPSVDEALTIASVVYGVPRGELSSVAWCESTHNPHARNGQYRGLFQQGPMFEATAFGRAGLSVWSPYAAALSTASVVAVQGWRQWQCRPGGRLAW